MAGRRQPGRLTRRQRLAVASLARGATNAEAAESANVGMRTVERWRSQADFVDALDHEADVALDEHRDKMRALVYASRDAVASAVAKGGARGSALAARVLLSSHVTSYAIGGGQAGVEHVRTYQDVTQRSAGREPPPLVGPGDPGYVPPPPELEESPLTAAQDRTGDE